MESKYHIITDLQCRVLHFGKEICIATPGEDACIELLKGRHLLSFVSTENPADSYKVEFKVPESEIEDFIEVRLEPIRQERIDNERKAEEKRRRDNELAEQKERERLKRVKDAEEKKIKDAEKRRIESLFYCKEFSRLNEYVSSLFENRGTCKVIIPSCLNGKYGLLKPSYDTIAEKKQSWIITPRYDIATPFFYGVSLVGEVVEMKPGYFDWKYYYINANSKIIYELSSNEQGIAFFLGVGIIIDKHETLRFIDSDGTILYEKPAKDVISIYSKRPEFPFSVFYGCSSHTIEFCFKNKEYERELSLKNNPSLKAISKGRGYSISAYINAEKEKHNTPDNYYLLHSYASFEELYFWM